MEVVSKSPNKLRVNKKNKKTKQQQQEQEQK